ncbi:MAG: hypothetical protein H6618_10165 [Deltaproteobacteria bacterium]|nr:hypothetical protein [Deltaproteobacteria bacterium]
MQLRQNKILYALFFVTVSVMKNTLIYADDEISLVNRLKDGGYVLYMRHHATDQSQKDRDRKNLKNCRTQRNLSEEGKQGSKDIRRAFSNLGIKVSELISSPYCRCKETALLAFGKAKLMDDLQFSIADTKAIRKEKSKALKILLSKKISSEGTNRVIVSHTANLKEAASVWPKPEGVIHVFKPMGDSFEHLGKIDPSFWKSIVNQR